MLGTELDKHIGEVLKVLSGLSYAQADAVLEDAKMEIGYRCKMPPLTIGDCNSAKADVHEKNAPPPRHP